MSDSTYDNMYDYLGLDPIFDDMTAEGRAAAARLKALPPPPPPPEPVLDDEFFPEHR